MEDFGHNPIPLKAEDNDQFPIGLRVLAHDTNIVCLHYLVKLLQKCQYKVSATTKVREAIRLLKDEKQTFDLVVTNVVGDDMDGFKILQIIGVGMDIPVVMVSANEELEMVKRGVIEGAEAYLLKPVRLEELKNIWQHVLRKRSAARTKRPNSNLLLLEQPVFEEDHNIIKTIAINQKDYDQNDDQTVKFDDINVTDSSSKKKKRISWTRELHQKFVEAYEQLREKERVPNNILKLMNDPSLTRENVASHLQKHRDTLKKKKASGGVAKLGSQKIVYDRNQTKGSTVYNSMYRMNKISNFQFPNGARLSMEEVQENKNPRSTWTAAGSFFPVPEFKWSNFPSNNNSVSKPCDDHNNQQNLGGFGPNCLTNYYSTSQSFVGNFPFENNQNNVGAISDQATSSLAWPSFPNNTTTVGQCSQMQFNAGNSHGSLLMDDDITEIFKQFQSEGAF